MDLAWQLADHGYLYKQKNSPAGLRVPRFGDTVAALGGQAWGKHVWASNPPKTLEGSGCFAVVSMIWALLFVRWPVAILGALSAAWVEARRLPYNDNLWVPLLGGAALSVLNLVLGR